MSDTNLSIENMVTCLHHFTDTLWEIDLEKQTVYIWYDCIYQDLTHKTQNYFTLYQNYLTNNIYSADIDKWISFLSFSLSPQRTVLKEISNQFVLRLSSSPSSEYEWYEIHYDMLENRKMILTARIIQKNSQYIENILNRQEKMLQYLDDIPIAFCVIRVDIKEENKPYDFVFTYINKAYSLLEGTTKEALLFSSYYDFFPDADKKWLNIYYKTAYEGISQEFIEYSPEIDKHLAISAYQPEYGYCACILRDVTKEVLLEMELEKSRERVELVLKNTTDAIFQIDLKTRTIYRNEHSIIKHNILPQISNIPYSLFENHLILENGISALEKALSELENGAADSFCEIQARFNENTNFSWYHISFSSYEEIYTKKRRVLGFLKNVNTLVLQREKLKKAASLDSLTGLYNVATGKMLIENILLMQNNNMIQNAFFLFDLDNFKEINDSYGHKKGDTILIHFANILKSTFRSKDIIYRLGGDEFAVFIENINSITSIECMMLALFSNLERFSKKDIKLSSSIGIFIGNSYHKFDDYYKIADAALYQSKRAGRHTYHVIDHSIPPDEQALG